MRPFSQRLTVEKEMPRACASSSSVSPICCRKARTRWPASGGAPQRPGCAFSACWSRRTVGRQGGTLEGAASYSVVEGPPWAAQAPTATYLLACDPPTARQVKWLSAGTAAGQDKAGSEV